MSRAVICSVNKKINWGNKMRSTLNGLFMAISVMGFGCNHALANVSPDKAAQLKSTLTPFGSERAGNSDGSIPAWTGGLTTMPAGLTGSDKMPDFFKNDAKVLTIDATNVDRYASRLSPGTIYMLKHYAGYRINVYPTHRTESAPQWFYDGTFRNATSATLKDNNWVVGAKGGLPYPIPQNGKEVAWNHNYAWFGVQTRGLGSTYIVSPNGTPLLNASNVDQRWFPNVDPNYTSGAFLLYYIVARESTDGPPNRVGEQILSWNAFDETLAPQITWQYLVGQRRLRKAPQVTYDGSFPDCGGITSVDELALWNGPPDRFDMKIIGKQEMYIPYNNNGMTYDTSDGLLAPNFLNPNDIRWELHRVWTLDLTLAAGKRNLYPHRRVYFDEDTWSGGVSEDYDASGTLAKIGQAFEFNLPAFPGTISTSVVDYDTRGSGYCLLDIATASHPQERAAVPANYPSSFFAPDTVAAESVR